MNSKVSIDLTTIFSAEAALGLTEYEDPKNRWFLYSLAVLSQAILDHSNLSISRPPSSKEVGSQPPGIVISFLTDKNVPIMFEESSQISKATGIVLTIEWLEQNKSSFQKVADNPNFWNQPALGEWLQWHKTFEWSFRWSRFNDKILGPEFEDFIRSLGRNTDEELFTLDVLTRGYYYRIVTDGDCWLHPIRTENLPTFQADGLIKSPFLDHGLFPLILTTLQEKTSSYTSIDRIKFWADRIAETKTFYHATSNIKDLKRSLASTWPVNDWENRVNKFEGIWNTLIDESKVIGVPEIITKTIKGLAVPLIDQAKLAAWERGNIAFDNAIERGKQKILLLNSKKDKGN